MTPRMVLQCTPGPTSTRSTGKPPQSNKRKEDTQPTGDPDVLPATPYFAPGTGQGEGPNASTAKSWCGLQDPCGTCPKVYIGQTGRTLKHRLMEHKRALRSGETAQSAVAEHAINEGHTIKWDDAEVVDHSTRFCQRCTLEAWHIQTEQHPMNRDEGPLPSVYNPLIHMSRPHSPH